MIRAELWRSQSKCNRVLSLNSIKLNGTCFNNQLNLQKMLITVIAQLKFRMRCAEEDRQVFMLIVRQILLGERGV